MNALRAGFLLLVAALLPAQAGETVPDKLFQERAAWIKGGGDAILDVDAMQPQERVTGGGGRALAVATSAERALDQDATDAAVALVRPFNTKALLVARNGRIELEWYADGFSAQSRTSPASMMKPVTALLTGAAIRDGHIRSVDDRIGRYITEWDADPRGDIRIRHLLTMSSGLEFPGDGEAGRMRSMQHFIGSDIPKIVFETPLVAEPGSMFQYNNINSSLLGMIIERATGQRFSDYLSSALWQPMGADDAAVWLDRPEGTARAFCCLIATTRDWLRLGLLMSNEGRVDGEQVIPASWVRAMTGPSATNPNFGYAVWRATPYRASRSYGPAVKFEVPAAKPFVDPETVYFDGSGGQRVYVSPKENLVIVRIGSAAPAWDDSALPNLIVNSIATGDTQ